MTMRLPVARPVSRLPNGLRDELRTGGARYVLADAMKRSGRCARRPISSNKSCIWTANISCRSSKRIPQRLQGLRERLSREVGRRSIEGVSRMTQAGHRQWTEARSLAVQIISATLRARTGRAACARSRSRRLAAWNSSRTAQLFCQYGVAIEDVMSLLSDGTPEDLGTDEIAKQAKYFIQPAVSKFRAAAA